jgi:DNA repair protein RecO (recombination protein O)
MVPAGGHPAELYPLLEHSLDALCEEGTPERPLADWFVLRMMQISGFGPQLTRCTVCRKDISETGSDVLFLCSRGGVLCPRCAGSGERPIPLRPDVLAILRHWQRCDSPEAAVRVSCSEEQLSQIGSVLKLFLEYHMEATFSSADILEHLLRREDGQVPERSMRQAHTE